MKAGLRTLSPEIFLSNRLFMDTNENALKVAYVRKVDRIGILFEENIYVRNTHYSKNSSYSTIVLYLLSLLIVSLLIVSYALGKWTYRKYRHRTADYLASI